MSDFGNDVGQSILSLSTKSMEQVANIIKYLLSLFKTDYNEKNAKNQFEKIQKQDSISKRSGYIGLKKLQESGFELTYAKSEMTREQLKSFLNHANKRGVPVSYISNGKNENGKMTYLAVFRTMDKDRIMDICDKLVRDTKLESIEKAMDDNTHYRKKDFENAIKSVDGKIIDKNNSIILCERTNPNNYIKVTGTQEQYEDGRPYIASHYELYKNGEKQKCEEFKHGEFIHNCDGEGHNSSEVGEQHWLNMKVELLNKGEFSDDMLVFKSEKDYEQYLSEFENNREQTEKDSAFYDELKAEKDKIIKDDVDNYNDKQAQGLFTEISGVAESKSMTFADTVDHFQVGDWEKDEAYYICRRTDPDNYIEVQVEQKKDYNGEDYNEHTYNVYVDDVQVTNPHREDGKFVDERFEGRPADYWKNMKAEMQKAGEFDNDCVVFVNKNDYLMYRQIYQQEHAQIKDPTMNFETNKDGLRNDFGYVQNYLEACKNDVKQFEDVGSYSDGSFTVNTRDDGSLDMKQYINNEVRIKEAGVISEQINNYQSMVKTANELVNEKAKLEAIEKSDLKNSDMFESMYKEQTEKVEAKINQMKEMQATEEKLWQQREQITGVKSEIQLRREEMQDTTEKTQFSEKELKDFAKTFKENKVSTSKETMVRVRTEKER